MTKFKLRVDRMKDMPSFTKAFTMNEMTLFILLVLPSLERVFIILN
jgi:hypothetical protein